MNIKCFLSLRSLKIWKKSMPAAISNGPLVDHLQSTGMYISGELRRRILELAEEKR